MGGSVRKLLALVLALTVGATIASCGGDDDATEGGSVTGAITSQPDALDPALSYTLAGWEPMWLVYTPLLTYRREEGQAGTVLIPGLAESLPEISEDDLTYTLTVRDGLEYSDGTPVRASDFEHTIKRALGMESPGSHFFMGIAGAEEYVAEGDENADVEGIVTDDQTGEVTIQLTAPDGTFSNALATNFAGLVPGDTPFENMTTDPPPGVGPYAIVESRPGRELVLERVEGFDLPDIPEGNLDRITIRVVESLDRQAEDVIRGDLDYMQDPPPPDLLPRIRDQEADRFREYTTGGTSFFFLNTREEPFDDERVRQAVNFAVDKPALARLYGGLLEPTCNFLPPMIAGHEELDPCPYGDPDEPPDLERARELIAEAGAEGAEVTVWGPTEGPGPAIAQAYADMLNQVGLEAEPNLVDFSVYIQSLGRPATGAQTGMLDFLQDFPHPASYLLQFSGSTITETANTNMGNVDDPELTREIDELAQAPDAAEAAERWAEVDRELIERAYVVPVGHPRRTTFFSERMDFESCARVHPVYQNDYSSFCLR